MKKFVTSFFLLPSLTYAFSVTGNFKSYPIMKDLVLYNDTLKTLNNSAKIQINNTLEKEIKFEMTYELSTLTEKHLPHATPNSSYRIADLNYYLHDESPSNKYQTSVSQNLNRLNLSVTTPIGDVTIGRVPLSFGVSKSISPNDVLTPIAINVIDKEERTGIDTLSFITQLTPSITLNYGAITGLNLDDANNAYYLRPKLTALKLDMTLNLINFKKKKLIGLEIQHPVKDAGFWVDYAYLDNNSSRLKDFSRFTSGLDYKFKNSLYLALEYHYNGSSLENTTIYPENFIYLRNYHYYILTSTYEITPLLITSLQTYNNPKDKSFFSSLKLDYNLTDNSYISLGTYLGLGNKITSEFERYGKIYYSSYRYYF